MTKQSDDVAASPPNLYQRLLAAASEIGTIQIERIQGAPYPIVSHDSVTKKVAPALRNNGILYFPQNLIWEQDGNRTHVTMVIRFINTFSPEEYLDVPTFGFGIGNDDKGPGKAMSYATKYALLKSLGLETGDDPDNDASATHIPAEEDKRPQGGAAGRNPSTRNGNNGSSRGKAGRPVTQPQLRRLYALMSEASGKVGVTDKDMTEGVKVWVEKKFGKESSKDLDMAEYDQLCAALPSIAGRLYMPPEQAEPVDFDEDIPF